MRCTVCMEDRVAKNSFTRGCSNFRKSALTEHVATLDHRNALKTPVHRSNQEEVTKIVLTKEENGIYTNIAQAGKAVHWIVSEDLPLWRYDSFMCLMAEYEVTDVDKLKVIESTLYTSRYTANDILKVLAKDVDAQAGKQVDESRLLSVLADETTDITVRKQMGIYVRTLDKDFVPYTRFLTNIHIDSGTGEAIATAILDVMSNWKVAPERIVALGSDGAAAMTGTNFFFCCQCPIVFLNQDRMSHYFLSLRTFCPIGSSTSIHHWSCMRQLELSWSIHDGWVCRGADCEEALYGEYESFEHLLFLFRLWNCASCK